MDTMSESPDLTEVTPRAGTVDGASGAEVQDPILELLYPQRPWRRRTPCQARHVALSRIGALNLT